VRLSATVADTAELRWWLLGFGEGVEVIGPKSLRNEFIETVKSIKYFGHSQWEL
jgi:predicted DNA-binding transcriptional regulator YafY